MTLSRCVPASHRGRYGVAAAAAAAALVWAGIAGAGSAQAAATVVPLGTAGQFAVLAGSGITNTGATTISGDTGSSPTHSETGFGTITQTGTNHNAPDPNDATTVQAKVDLTTGYNNAAGQTPPIAKPTELGGQTLTAGVYKSDTFGITGTLTLNGQGDPSSVFVFQAGSTLITAVNSKVSLINGASSCNVFWQVGSAATLGTGSTFVGTILAHDNISLNKAVTVDGRLLAGEQASGEGAVTLINDTITAPKCATPPTTTTTAPGMTTTTAPPVTTTTTAPGMTTTTAPPVTTTTTAPGMTTTTAPPVTTTTTAPGMTTTTAPPVTSSTAPGMTTTTGPAAGGPGAGGPGAGGPGTGGPGAGGPGAGGPGAGGPGAGGSGQGAEGPGAGGPGAGTGVGGGPGAGGQVARIPAGAVEAGDGSTS